MKFPLAWLDQRTGYRRLLHEALFENVPGGSRWRYVWGSTLSFALGVQFITGIFRKKWGVPSDEALKLSEAMGEYWTLFAATGDPNDRGLPKWPSYDARSDLCLQIGRSVGAVPVPRAATRAAAPLPARPGA